MAFGFATYMLGYLSGLLSTLSPCVLPLLPIVLGSAVAAGRFGALALTLGTALSFSAVGILLATVGATMGLNEDGFHYVAAAVLVVAGLALLVPAVANRFGMLVSGASVSGQDFLHRIRLGGMGGQFVIGLTLGAVWSPCVGPTLGAAIALAARGKDLVQVAMLMAIYGLGAASPMLLLGSLSRASAARFRGRLLSIGHVGKHVLGSMLCIVGALALSGLDKTLEAAAVEHSPAWLIDLTTRI